MILGGPEPRIGTANGWYLPGKARDQAWANSLPEKNDVLSSWRGTNSAAVSNFEDTLVAHGSALNQIPGRLDPILSPLRIELQIPVRTGVWIDAKLAAQFGPVQRKAAGGVCYPWT